MEQGELRNVIYISRWKTLNKSLNLTENVSDMRIKKKKRQEVN